MAVKPVAYTPGHTSPTYRVRSKMSIRKWAVSHSRFFELVYSALSKVFLKLHPVFSWIGFKRVEKPIIVVEKLTKGFLFDCRMCGQCALGDTGMSCPMNCPKNLRNGPCGGVRANGNCEVEPDMPCVWVEAWRGSQNMREQDRILDVQPPIDHSLKGSSSWLRATSIDAMSSQTEKGD